MKKIFFLSLFILLISCKTDVSNYYNAESEQYIQYLENKNNDLETENQELQEKIEELEEKLLEYE